MPTPRLAAALLVLATTAAACTGNATVDRAEPTTTTTARSAPATTAGFDPAPIEWEPCGGVVECGSLEVPLDHDDPAGPTIEIAVARVPAADPDERIGPLLVNPGGPGGSGVDMVRGGFRLGPEIADRFDLIGWDPRGVGGSIPLSCDDGVAPFLSLDPEPDDAGEQQALEDAARGFAEECASEDGDLLGQVATDDVVDDLDLLRRSLGDDQVSYVGFSYGTLIGLRFAEAYPTSVRAMVLDGVVDPSDDLATHLEAQTHGIEAAVDRIAEDCAGSGDCPLDDLLAAYDRVSAAAEAGELGPVGPAELATATIYATYDPATWDRLTAALADALDGDATGVSALADAYSSLAGFNAYVAITCVDTPRPAGPDDHRDLAEHLASISPRFGAAIANELLPCAFWAAPTDGQATTITAAGAPPILVVGNTGDAATPYESAEAVAAMLGDARLLTYAGEGHTSIGRSACIDEHVVRYLIDRTLPPDATVC